MSANIKTMWFLGLSPEQTEEFKKTLLSNRTLVQQLLKILEHKYETVERKGFKEEDYDSSDWVFKQAFNNGRLCSLKEIADLFNFTEK